MSPRPAKPRPLLTAAILAAFTIILGLGLISTGRMPSRVAYDQKLYHEDAIRQFAQQWPDFDLWHYKSATTPGYHILLAAVARFISPSVTALQLTSLAIAAALSFLLGWTVGSRAPPLLSVAACLPLACQVYVVQSSAWLLPDDLGWLGVLSILVIALRPRTSPAWLVTGGLILLALVFVRQIHAWAAGLLWVAAWLMHPPAEPSDERDPLIHWDLVFGDVPRQVGRTLLALGVTLPAVLLLALFARYWQGLVPPIFQGWYRGMNASAFVMILATFGAYSPFFVLSWWPHAARLWRNSRGTLVGVLAVVLIATIVVPTTHDYPAGRRTGLWNIAAQLPVIAGHTSPFMVALALLGTLTLLAFAYAAAPRARIVLLSAVLGFIAASTANHDLFQRYVDPFALILLAIFTGSAGSATGVSLLSRLRPAGPLLLALAFLGITLNAMRDTDALTDPPPSASQPGEPPTPAELPRPPEPPNHRFWPL